MKKKSKVDIAHELVAAKIKTAAERPSPKGKGARQPKKPQQNLAPNKLMLLVTIVNREKGEYFLDLIQSFQSNLQLSFSASGTASKAMGLLSPDAEKTVIFSVITSENAKLALYTLNKKFSTIRGGKGVALTIPMTSTIGVAIYRFLSNKE